MWLYLADFWHVFSQVVAIGAVCIVLGLIIGKCIGWGDPDDDTFF